MTKFSIKPLLTFAFGMTIAVQSSVPVHAASTEWFETDGGRMRLIIENSADENGVLNGVVEIDLDEGWKTYWRDPGGSGIPPTFDFSATSSVTHSEIAYPAPTLIDDGYSVYAGYNEDVSFPIKLMTEPMVSPHLKGELFIGVCSTVCVPFGATVDLKLDELPMTSSQAIIIETSGLTLPQAQSADFMLDDIKLDTSGQSLEYKLTLPAFFPNNVKPELFVQSPYDLPMSQPKLLEIADGSATFLSEVYEIPDLAKLENEEIYIVMKLGQRASETSVSIKEISASE